MWAHGRGTRTRARTCITCPAPLVKQSRCRHRAHTIPHAHRIDEQIKKLDEQLAKFREQIKRTRPGPAQEALKRRALTVLKQKRMYENQRDTLYNQQFNMEQTRFTVRAHMCVRACAAGAAARTQPAIVAACVRQFTHMD